MTKIIAICNQKGGVGKTTTAANLGIGLAMAGKRVLLVDSDPQSDLTAILGWQNSDSLSATLTDVLKHTIMEDSYDISRVILNHAEDVDLIPSNIELSVLEMNLISVFNREYMLRDSLSSILGNYDYILIDCPPSLSMLTVNALAAAGSVIIPVQAQYLPAKGMTQLVRTIQKVKKQINPELEIEGILLTLADMRTTLARSVYETLKEQYGGRLNIFKSQIPVSTKAAESGAAGHSIFVHDGNGRAAGAYMELVSEVLACGG